MASLLLALLDGGLSELGPDVADNGRFDVMACTSLGDLWSAARRAPGSVALVDWRRIDGLVSDEHRHFLFDIDQAAPLVVLFDKAAGRHMSANDLGVTAVLDKPIAAEDLVALLIGVSRSALPSR